jgi:hypothetical protein
MVWSLKVEDCVLKMENGFGVGEGGAISVAINNLYGLKTIYPGPSFGIDAGSTMTFDEGALVVKYGAGLEEDAGGLRVSMCTDSGIGSSIDYKVMVRLDKSKGLEFQSGKVAIALDVSEGLKFQPDGSVAAKLYPTGGLEALDNGIQVNPEEVVRANSVWVTHSSQNPSLFALPENAKVLSVDCWVEELFNSDGSDQISVGYDALADAYATAIDVSTTGVKTVTLGSVAKTVHPSYSTVECYYVNGGTEPTTGKASITITWTLITAVP